MTTNQESSMFELVYKIEKQLHGYDFNFVITVLSGVIVSKYLKTISDSQDKIQRRFLIDMFNNVVLRNMKQSFDHMIMKLKI